ncbi:hypothetical protein PFLUV_G00000760 [Perca fluviatilis]|uniref:Uncharacterized protein n=1 Tax=Perca fluviatilis TaxID=8168 RepID=A0A6A5EZB5_PERFL|nr:hypothetical protein PFLUV_G00000760 [Perca fluviatilis]
MMLAVAANELAQSPPSPPLSAAHPAACRSWTMKAVASGPVGGSAPAGGYTLENLQRLCVRMMFVVSSSGASR